MRSQDFDNFLYFTVWEGHLVFRPVAGGHTVYFPSPGELRGTPAWTQPEAPPVAPRRESVSRLEAIVSRFPLRTLRLAANQTRDQPQSISECPGLRAPTEPPGIGARSCPGNPKPSLIIILSFVSRQTAPTDCRLAHWAQKAPQPPAPVPRVHRTPSGSGCLPTGTTLCTSRAVGRTASPGCSPTAGKAV